MLVWHAVLIFGGKARYIDLWGKGEIQELLREGQVIQRRLATGRAHTNVFKVGDISRHFASRMLRGDVKAAIAWECINTGLDYWNGGMVDWIVFFFVFHYLMHAHIQKYVANGLMYRWTCCQC